MTSTTSNTPANIPCEFMCPLTLELMNDPVMTRWGHNFERMPLLKWLQRHDECPLTRKAMGLQDIIRNRALKERIRVWIVQHADDDELADTRSNISTALDKTAPLFVLAKSSKTVIRALEDKPEDPRAKSILKKYKKERRELKRRQRAVAA